MVKRIRATCIMKQYERENKVKKKSYNEIWKWNENYEKYYIKKYNENTT